MSDEITFDYTICGEHSEKLALGGITVPSSVMRPMSTCPSCGPIHWEILQVCKEITIGSYLN